MVANLECRRAICLTHALFGERRVLSANSTRRERVPRYTLLMKWFAVISMLVAATCLRSCAPTELPPEFRAIGTVRVHEGDDPRWAGAAWNDHDWPQMHWGSVSSYDRVVWLRARLQPGDLPRDEPVVVAVSAVAAYEVYWNGTLIGGSGKHGRSRPDEKAGAMDSSSRVPDALIAEGVNVLAIRLSSFRLASRLDSTIHFLYAGADPGALATLRLRNYVPGIAASGALLLGACYFAGLFLSHRRDRAAGFLALLSVAALAQFGAEVVRAFVNYEYPLHIVRLWAVLAMACCYGCALVAYVSERCNRAKLRQALGITAAGMALGIMFIPGYDSKTSLVIVFAAAVAVGLALKARPRRWLIVTVPAALILWFLLSPWNFLDQHLYLVTVASILLLFFEQARYLRSEQGARAVAELRSARLELELLKRYIQPHFLLNTLTSLAEWVETEPQTGVRMIEALADEFRLLSRIGSQRAIEVRDEIILCRLHLQVMSLRHDTQLQLTTEGVQEHRQIPPAILHTLIENALTHNRYPDGATFHLRETSASESRRYELSCPPGKHDDRERPTSQGIGLDYVRARLAEAFADRWQLTDMRAADGGWTTYIDIRA